MNSRCIFLEPTQVTSPKVLQFARYWRSKSQGEVPPPPGAMDPGGMVALLPFVVIAQVEGGAEAEVEGGPPRVRYRLVGTRIVEAHGSDYTNRYLDECGFLIEADLKECYRRVVAGRRPMFLYYEWQRSEWPSARGKVGASEAGFFPLSSDGRVVDRVISIADPEVTPRRVRDLR